MSKSKIFIKGGGGFSKNLGIIVKSNNNIVIDPKEFN